MKKGFQPWKSGGQVCIHKLVWLVKLQRPEGRVLIPRFAGSLKFRLLARTLWWLFVINNDC